MSKIVNRGIRISDAGIRAISGNRHSWKDAPMRHWTDTECKRYQKRQMAEWEQARTYYRELKRKYTGKV